MFIENEFGRGVIHIHVVFQTGYLSEVPVSITTYVVVFFFFFK